MTVAIPESTKQYLSPLVSSNLITIKFIGTKAIRNIKVVNVSMMEGASYIIATVTDTELKATIANALPMSVVE